MKVNLISSRKKGVSVNWVRIIVTVAAVIIVSIMGINFYLLQVKQWTLNQNIDQLQKQYEMTKPAQEEYLSLQKKIKELKQEQFPEIKEFRWDTPLIQISYVIPAGAVLNSLQIQGDQLILMGTTEQAEELSKFIKNIQNSPVFYDVILERITKEEKISFTLKAKINEGVLADAG